MKPRVAVMLAGLVALLGVYVAVGPGASLALGSTEFAASSGRNEIPDAEVRDVKSGETVNIHSLAPSELPILFWFWAPH